MSILGNLLTTAMAVMPQTNVQQALELPLVLDVPFWPQFYPIPGITKKSFSAQESGSMLDGDPPAIYPLHLATYTGTKCPSGRLLPDHQQQERYLGIQPGTPAGATG